MRYLPQRQAVQPFKRKSPKSQKSKLHLEIQRSWQLYLLILPSIVTVFIFHYIPIYGVQIAFKNFRTSLGIIGSEWVGLKHFIRFLSYRDFWQIMGNTVAISLYSLATFPCSVIFALMINEIDNKAYKRTVQMLSYAPHFVSTVVVCSMVLLFLDRSNGIINTLLEMLGFARRDFMTQPDSFYSIYVWSGVWKSLGWGTIIYLAALSSVSPELIEAAKIDGASRMQIVMRVNLPSILPTIITVFILNTGSILSVGFEKIFLLQNALNLERSRVISTYVYEIGIQGGQFSYSSAIGLFNNAINIICITLVNVLSKRLTQVSLW
ncbi:MAG: ABC transporter permease [Christensenellales bacterium]|jgi:putative aldouronate transport system permease protein